MKSTKCTDVRVRTMDQCLQDLKALVVALKYHGLATNLVENSPEQVTVRIVADPGEEIVVDIPKEQTWTYQVLWVSMHPDSYWEQGDVEETELASTNDPYLAAVVVKEALRRYAEQQERLPEEAVDRVSEGNPCAEVDVTPYMRPGLHDHRDEVAELIAKAGWSRYKGRTLLREVLPGLRPEILDRLSDKGAAYDICLFDFTEQNLLRILGAEGLEELKVNLRELAGEGA